jgi:hypothetical protein
MSRQSSTVQWCKAQSVCRNSLMWRKSTGFLYGWLSSSMYSLSQNFYIDLQACTTPISEIIQTHFIPRWKKNPKQSNSRKSSTYKHVITCNSRIWSFFNSKYDTRPMVHIAQLSQHGPYLNIFSIASSNCIPFCDLNIQFHVTFKGAHCVWTSTVHTCEKHW